MTPYVVAIDPGIDDTALAVFRLPAVVPCGFTRALQDLEGVQMARTKPDEPLADRLRWIHQVVTGVADRYAVVQWYVELPTTAGAYAAKRARQRTKGGVNADALAKLYLAIGTIVGAITAQSSELTFLPAPKLPKLQRRAVVQSALQSARPDRPRYNEHQIDALYLGAAALGSGTYTTSLQRAAR